MCNSVYISYMRMCIPICVCVNYIYVYMYIYIYDLVWIYYDTPEFDGIH